MPTVSAPTSTTGLTNNLLAVPQFTIISHPYTFPTPVFLSTERLPTFERKTPHKTCHLMRVLFKLTKIKWIWFRRVHMHIPSTQYMPVCTIHTCGAKVTQILSAQPCPDSKTKKERKSHPGMRNTTSRV
jgi:hypothetical protein